MKEQMLTDEIIQEILKTQLFIKLMHFDDLHGAPSQVVSQLVLQAYSDNYDYFYQINDDTVFVTPNWMPILINSLVSNPIISNFGVTGPQDTNNNRIFTHCFIHRTHIDVSIVCTAF